ncbi:MAG: PadR family transcriptional regulator [Cyclobacteriaceae bacterium]|nr:helix-turn-helix transcriptional regulator [Cyclobacteriaceae bacterium]
MSSKKELIKGTLRLIVLKLLSENTRMYGYEITQRVKELSGNQIELTFGALYPTLHKLESEKLIVSKTVVIDGRARKYYSLNKAGLDAAATEVADYFTFSKALNMVLS